jgi:hypothetical protein
MASGPERMGYHLTVNQALAQARHPMPLFARLASLTIWFLHERRGEIANAIDGLGHFGGLAIFLSDPCPHLMHSHSARAAGKGLSESIGRKVLRVRVPSPFTDELHGVATRQPLLNFVRFERSEPLA